MKTSKQAELPRELTIADFIVRSARGHATKNGVAFSGRLWMGDEAIADFRNAGNGGCHVWTVHNLSLFAEFERIAKAQLPNVRFEQSDIVVGTLWDKAFMKDTTMGAK